ncbi:MAG: glucose-1-phosphate adenylyltransferase subunit GlgD [Oscillospiraceae bacterium]
MTDLHGIIYAYHSYSSLGELVTHRTSASLPFCSRYRLIDFALSSMRNAGVRDVGVIMQRDYQSLLDHLGSGKAWDLSRGSGGLRLLPPFGMHDSRLSEYKGCMEALSAMRSYIRDIKQTHIALFRGDLAVNLDLDEIFDHHLASGAEITAVCTETPLGSAEDGISFVPDTPTTSRRMLFTTTNIKSALPSVEVYIIRKSLLLDLIDWCSANGKLHFHRDALAHYLENGGKVSLYVHNGYIAHISTIPEYYAANMDMLNHDIIRELFPEERPIYTRGRSSVSTYYGENASAKNSLVADGCYIEGELENCVVFRRVKIKKGAKLKNCVIMQDTVVGEGANLTYVISDKEVTISSGLVLTGSNELPVTIPKGKSI